MSLWTRPTPSLDASASSGLSPHVQLFPIQLMHISINCSSQGAFVDGSSCPPAAQKLWSKPLCSYRHEFLVHPGLVLVAGSTANRVHSRTQGWSQGLHRYGLIAS